MRARAKSRSLLGVATATVLTVAVLAGCSPDPQPPPTPTGAFASEEEAFAAAEETYRAYIDAVNEQRRGIQTDPQDFLIGLALKNDQDTKDLSKSEGPKLQGDGLVQSFRGDSAELSSLPNTITTTICLDVSATRVINSEGADITPASRAEKLLLSVQIIGSSTNLRISDSTTDEEAC